MKRSAGIRVRDTERHEHVGGFHDFPVPVGDGKDMAVAQVDRRLFYRTFASKSHA